MDWRDRIAWVTGAGSGLGLETAKRLAAAGAHIVGFDRTGADATRTAIEAARASPAQRVRLHVADVADREATLEAFAAAATAGMPDLLVHMAGVGGVAEMVSMPFAMFDRMIKINVYGMRNVVEAALPHMLGRGREPAARGPAQQRGDRAGSESAGGADPNGAGPQRTSRGGPGDGVRPKIVLAGSMGGIVPVYGYTAYGTSKFAVVGFAKCLRYELRPRGIDVACFCPGEVATPALAAERQQTHPATLALKVIGGTMSTERAVDGLMAGLATGRFLIVPGWRTRLVHLALKLTPEPLWNAVTDFLIARALRLSTRTG